MSNVVKAILKINPNAEVSVKNDDINEIIWEKETILSSPTRKKLVFSNSSSLQYDVEISKKSSIFWTNYYFQSNIKNLEIDKKYPEINQYLNIDQM